MHKTLHVTSTVLILKLHENYTEYLLRRMVFKTITMLCPASCMWYLSLFLLIQNTWMRD